MSGIFKGDSIYKSGGGGGGYKDGGELIDGDFIKVENNTISSYDNVSRDPVNFYFEYKEGEVVNSIIEFTTQINSTINVYIIKNGFYYLLGNIGGNTVNAGEDYKVNIIGDSYDVEQVSGGLNPEYAEIGVDTYPIGKYGSLYMMKSNLRGFSSIPHETANGQIYYKAGFDFKNFSFGGGWRIPTLDDLNNVISALDPDGVKKMRDNNTPYSTWNSNSSNISGLSLYPWGDIQSGYNYELGTQCRLLAFGNPEMTFKECWIVKHNTNTPTAGSVHDVIQYLNVRLVKNV